MTIPAASDPALRAQVTGVVLAGGRGSRMGGVDKGLQPFRGRPLAAQVLERLRPQVGALMINANRNPERYAEFGVPVWPDEPAGYDGPLAGFRCALAHAGTPLVLVVPCDSPLLPTDLVARLGAALQAEGADVASAATWYEGRRQRQPVFALLRRTLLPDLAQAMEGGERKIDRWFGRHRLAEVLFEDAAPFANVNTTDELQRLEQGLPPLAP